MTRNLLRAAVCLAAGAVLMLTVGLLIPDRDSYASASDGTERITLATGFMDNRTEAVFYLDSLTGELKAAVLDPDLGRFMAFYVRNISGDFPRVENPRYAMVTGLADFPGGQNTFARTAIYIAEQTSGQVAAYALPWSTAVANRNAEQAGPFILLDRRQFRLAYIRD
jgi:hypothetical protein